MFQSRDHDPLGTLGSPVTMTQDIAVTTVTTAGGGGMGIYSATYAGSGTVKFPGDWTCSP